MSYDPVMADLDRHLCQIDREDAAETWRERAAMDAAEERIAWLERASVAEGQPVRWSNPTTATVLVEVEVTIEPEGR